MRRDEEFCCYQTFSEFWVNISTKLTKTLFIFFSGIGTHLMSTFPNILVLSAGGYGHVPIPLIMGELPYVEPHANNKYSTEVIELCVLSNIDTLCQSVLFPFVHTNCHTYIIVTVGQNDTKTADFINNECLLLYFCL